MSLDPSSFMQYNFDQPQTIRLWGSQCAPILRKRIAAANEKMRTHQVSQTLVNDRLAAFTDMLDRLTPRWLDEAKHIADGAGVLMNDILKLNCLPRALEYCGGGCTSFIRIGEQSNSLLKIRDEANNTQYYMPRKVNHLWYHAAADIGNLGYAHVLSGNGISGGNNTGSPATGVSDVVGMTDCHAMRYIIEHASTVDDIPAILEQLLDAKAITGAGPNRGSILMFCDSRRGLTLEYTLDNYVATFIDSGMYVVSNHFQTPQAAAWRTEAPEVNSTTRLCSMRDHLAKCHNAPLPSDVFEMVRDTNHAPDALCNDDAAHEWMSVSVQLHEIHHTKPAKSSNHLCCGNPRFSPFLKAPLHQQQAYIPLASGQYYTAADQRYRSRLTHAQDQQALYDFEAENLKRPSFETACDSAYQWLTQPQAQPTITS